MPDIHTVVDSYGDYLSTKSKTLWRRFQCTCKDSPASAMAEAAVFRVVQKCGAAPEIADMVNQGGPDFLCVAGSRAQFMIEATSSQPRKITDDTGLRDSVPDEIAVQAFGLLTKQIDEKATQKRRQFSALLMLGVLAIASHHFGAIAVLNSVAATNALVSEPFWVHGQDAMSTNLGSSLFLRREPDGIVVAKNTSISAVLLMAVSRDRSYVCGAINPAATHRLEMSVLWQIPFVYLKDWPIEGGKIRCAWTMGNLRTHEVPHGAVLRS